MGPGFKYHIVTVAGIFFALTIGLILGSQFVSPILISRLDRSMKALQTTYTLDLNEEKKKNEERKRLDQAQECLATVAPLAIRDRLKDIPIAIIQIGDYPDTAQKVKDSLVDAGAHVLSLITLDPKLARSDEVLKSNLKQTREQNAWFPQDREGMLQKIAAVLAHRENAPEKFLELASQEGFIRIDSTDDYKTAARIVIIVMGSNQEETSRPDVLDRSLVNALKQQGIVVLACEPEDAKVSDIPDYRRLNIDVTTVDNVDTTIGKCALVFAVNGDKDDYGVKPTAHKLLPAQTVKQK